MNIYGKVTLLAFCSAIAGSMATVVAVNTIGGADISSSSQAAVAPSAKGSLFTVGNSVTPPTDFTHAAESTINGVVSIKSYVTPRGYNMGGATVQRSVV